MLIYKENFDLFDAPKGTLLMHSCNAQGIWGSGVALQFKEKFFVEYEMYNIYCNAGPEFTLGTGIIFNRVACIIASNGYSHKVDDNETILKNTETSIKMIIDNSNGPIYLPKINSGLFKVPWEKTELIIKEFVKHRDFYVCLGKNQFI